MTWDWISAAAVAAGGAAGAWLRWFLSLRLNALSPRLPSGTLAANLLGGFLMGFLAEGLALHWVPESFRLLLTTGFLGGLTTFSTFSAEVVNSIRHQRPGWAVLAIGAHVGGSLALTVVGIRAARYWLA
jgi:CrcB protein